MQKKIKMKKPQKQQVKTINNFNKIFKDNDNIIKNWTFIKESMINK